MVCLLVEFGSCRPLSRFHVGFSLLLFIATIWALTYEQGRHASNRPMISVAIVLLVLSTFVSTFVGAQDLDSLPDRPLSFKHMVVDIVRIDEGLVKYRDTFPGGPVAFFGDVTQGTFVIKNAIYALQTLLGDGVVVGSDPCANCTC